MVVNVVVIHVSLQPKVGISLSSNGREQMDVPGMNGLAWLQLVVGISPASNGRERMNVIGMEIRNAKLNLAATRNCSSTLLIKATQSNERLCRTSKRSKEICPK